jgi:hypothetical protein
MSYFLSSPISQVEEIIPDRALADFGNGRQNALELIHADAPHDFAHKFFFIPGFNSLIRRPAFIHQQVQQLIRLFIGKAQLTLIGLSSP